MQLSDRERQTLHAEQDLLGRVIDVVRGPGPCDPVALAAVLRGRPATEGTPGDQPDELPADVPTGGAEGSARHLGVLVIPYPRSGGS